LLAIRPDDDRRGRYLMVSGRMTGPLTMSS